MLENRVRPYGRDEFQPVKHEFRPLHKGLRHSNVVAALRQTPRTKRFYQHPVEQKIILRRMTHRFAAR
jgi:hypothetical protein